MVYTRLMLEFLLRQFSIAVCPSVWSPWVSCAQTISLEVASTATDLATSKEIVCAQDTHGDQTEGQTAMENCLSKNSSINLVYTINEPAAFGAYTALKNAGKEKDVTIVSVDGGCQGVQGVVDGKIAATSQQYPLKMASMGVEAIVKYAKDGTKPTGYTDTGVTLITDKAPVSYTHLRAH